jgi:hypothetical protein
LPSLDPVVGARLEANETDLTAEDIDHLNTVHDTDIIFTSMGEDGIYEDTSAEDFYTSLAEFAGEPADYMSRDMFISAEPSTGQLSGESFPADLASSVIQDDESMTGSVPVRDTRTREVRGLADAWIAAPINAKRVPIKPRVKDELIYMNKCKINQKCYLHKL